MAARALMEMFSCCDAGSPCPVDHEMNASPTCLPLGGKSAAAAAGRTSASGSSVPLCSCASSARPSCPPRSSTCCRSPTPPAASDLRAPQALTELRARLPTAPSAQTRPDSPCPDSAHWQRGVTPFLPEGRGGWLAGSGDDAPSSATSLGRGLSPAGSRPWVGPGKPNLPLGLRGKAGGCARVTAGLSPPLPA